MDYKNAGVDIEAGYRSVELIKKHVKMTERPEVLGGLGGFSGAFDLKKIKDMDDLAGILSKYILEGQTKGTVWAEGVYTGVLYQLIYKMDDLIHFWGTMSY